MCKRERQRDREGERGRDIERGRMIEVDAVTDTDSVLKCDKKNCHHVKYSFSLAISSHNDDCGIWMEFSNHAYSPNISIILKINNRSN